MDANVDINRQTHTGTALHEAALYGKINAVKLFIDVSSERPFHPQPNRFLVFLDYLNNDPAMLSVSFGIIIYMNRNAFEWKTSIITTHY